jgi:hypothetical protein
MNPISLVHLHKLLLPSPRSHWSATDLGARPNRQPLDNTQWKTTRAPTATEKPVRPVSETGQTASVGLSLSTGKETGQTGLANQGGRFCSELPKNTLRPKTPQEPFLL